jgi:3-hydroxyisobutyrate dehydrogenase-like beta-hydroxyacid dehydrogenase
MKTIGILGSGDMGSGVAAAFVAAGFCVVSDLSERSAHSRMLAERAGTIDRGSLAAVLAEAELVLSIVPPAQAQSVATAVGDHGPLKGIYADCNAVAPAKALALLEALRSGGTKVLDVGIIGSPPARAGQRGTRFYVAGADRSLLLELDVPGISFLDMGPDIGRASAIKMMYASLNKGVDALLTTVALSAMQLGVRAELFSELDASQPQLVARMRRSIPFLAAAAQRYVPEMREIAATYSAAGTTADFHEGAAWLYAVLARSKFASETRASLPRERSLEVALDAFADALNSRE